MKLQVPGPIREEHQEFRDELILAANSGGRLGPLAGELLQILDPHFALEEEVAFPPLILMHPLSLGEITQDMRSVLPVISRLKKEIPNLTEDHQHIIADLEKFDEYVKIEGKPEFNKFSKRLIHHAKAEEGILFPAAILIGEYLRLKIKADIARSFDKKKAY